MAVFILETDAVTSAATSVSSLASEVANIGSSVSGYDTSCEDGFNFAGAKGVIASNIEACSVKIQNTAKVMETVVSNHTDLQNKLKFQDPATASGTDTGTNTTGTNTTGTNTTGTDTSGGNTYSGGDYGSYGGSWGGGGGDGGDVSIPTPTQEEKKDKKGVITGKLSKIGYAVADDANISDETKALLKDKLFKYDKNGYAMIGERYVIACDSSLANVGDVIRFTQKDGSVVECVVGITTVSEKYKNMVNFIVDSKAEGIKALDISKTLFTGNNKIENIGTLNNVRSLDLGSVIQQALQNGTSTATPATTVPITSGTTTTVETPTTAPATTSVSTTGTQVVDYTNTDNGSNTVQV